MHLLSIDKVPAVWLYDLSSTLEGPLTHFLKTTFLLEGFSASNATHKFGFDTEINFFFTYMKYSARAPSQSSALIMLAGPGGG